MESIHASLKNLRPQMNSRMLSSPRNPGLFEFVEKAKYWKVQSANSPIVATTKMRI